MAIPKRIIEDQYIDLKSESSTRIASPTPRTADAALAFIQQQRALHSHELRVDDKKLLRKIDFRIVPIMFACYTMQFIDKVNINYAAVMGLNQDLRLGGNEFSWCATAFFIAFLVAEIPTVHGPMNSERNTFKLKFPSYNRLCSSLSASFWLTILNLIGFQHVENSFASWRVMFLVLGGVTILIGIWTMWKLPDTPMTSSWLTEQERLAVLERVEKNQTGVSSTEFKPKQLLELFLDPQIWALFLYIDLVRCDHYLFSDGDSWVWVHAKDNSPVEYAIWRRLHFGNSNLRTDSW
ncbi:Sialin [Drechslerella dactyloides]|uniref:Sialin n=1 Tax=Drechslerella dactyloides TaxID=74499 RepID=A0AAD6NH82_DREDA|nr:Sialin [Drechslerella dactyloides]